MTGHELDLDEIRRLTRGAEGGLLVTNTIPALCDEVESLRVKLAAAEQREREAKLSRSRAIQAVADRGDAFLELYAERDELRAKLAAAEQERDTAKVNAVAALRLLEADRDKLAAVREAVEPLAGFALDEFARRYARRDEDAAIVVQALYDLHQVLAAAEQPEPAPEQP